MEELKPRQLEYMSHQPKGHTAELILSNSTARLFPLGHFTCTTKDMGTARVSTNHMDPEIRVITHVITSHEPLVLPGSQCPHLLSEAPGLERT